MIKIYLLVVPEKFVFESWKKLFSEVPSSYLTYRLQQINSGLHIPIIWNEEPVPIYSISFKERTTVTQNQVYISYPSSLHFYCFIHWNSWNKCFQILHWIFNRVLNRAPSSVLFLKGRAAKGFFLQSFWAGITWWLEETYKDSCKTV